MVVPSSSGDTDRLYADYTRSTMSFLLLAPQVGEELLEIVAGLQGIEIGVLLDVLDLLGILEEACRLELGGAGR